MKNVVILSILLSIFSFGGIKNLELEKAIELLKSNNSQLKIANLDNLIKDYDISMANTKHLGKLDLTIDGVESDSPLNAFAFKLQNKRIAQSDFDPKKLNNPESATHYKVNLSYKVPLYAGGRILEYRQIAKSMYEISQLDKRNTLNKQILETKKVFYNISLISKYIKNLSTISKNINKLKRSVKSMRKEGYTTNTDVLEIRSRISKVDSMYKEALSHKKMSYQFLSFLLNEEVDSIKETETMAVLDSESDYDIAKTIDVQKAQAGLKIQESMSSIEFANFIPTVGFFANYDMENDKPSDFEDSYSVGIRVSANLFNGGGDMVKYQQHKIKTIQSKEQVNLAKRGLSLKINKLKSQTSSSQNNVNSLKDRLKLLQDIYKLYRAKYKEGLVSINDVLIKQSKEIEVLIELLAARSVHNASILELNYIKNEGK